MNPSNRYSQHAKRSLRYARTLARECSHPEVDTDHLFVGILHSQGSVGEQILSELKIDRARAEHHMAYLHESNAYVNSRLAYSQMLHNALDLAVDESSMLGHHYIGTEHLLLGLMRQRRGQLVELLAQLDVSSEQIRRRVRRLLVSGVSEITLEAARRMAKLSELGRRVLNAAKMIAQSYEQESVTMYHLLLVLCRERRSVVSRLLVDCGLDVERLVDVCAMLPDKSIVAEAELDYMVDRAVDRAVALGSHYTGTEHLLLAMMLIPTGQLLLYEFWVDIEQLREGLDAIFHRD